MWNCGDEDRQKFVNCWLSALNNLKKRSVFDIQIATSDGFSRFSEVIYTEFFKDAFLAGV